MTADLVDCRVQIEIGRMSIEIVDRRLLIAGSFHNQQSQSTISINNPQSQSTIRNLTNPQSSIRNRQWIP
jgi:hypothetical protein